MQVHVSSLIPSNKGRTKKKNNHLQIFAFIHTLSIELFVCAVNETKLRALLSIMDSPVISKRYEEYRLSASKIGLIEAQVSYTVHCSTAALVSNHVVVTDAVHSDQSGHWA